jgi:hypothetical protein
MNSNIKDIYTIMMSYDWNEAIIDELKNNGIVKYDEINNYIDDLLDIQDDKR